MKKTTFILLLNLLSIQVYGQIYEIDNVNNQTINTCSGTFYDSGGAVGNYSDSENYTVTFCPAIANQALRVDFSNINIGTGDQLCVFNGSNTLAPVLTCLNPATTGAFSFIANNAQGCLTFSFSSDATPTFGTGWAASLSCQVSCQTVIADIISATPAISPPDTGYIDICEGDQITLTAAGVYPQNNASYAQSDATSTFEWLIEGQSFSGPTVSHVFNNAGGYRVQLKITDINGCSSSNSVNQRVRVAPPPSFSGTSASDTTACIGDTVNLFGNIIPTTQNFASSLTRGDSIFLPDGNGVCYQTTLEFTDFNPTQTLTNINDLLGICVNMEHSWIGDLDITLTCPNGNSTVLVPNPNSGGGLNLGVPINFGSGPGTGFDYCWTPSSTITWNQATANGMTVTTTSGPSLAPGNYASSQPLTNLIGCPLNGQWELQICDNIGADDGYIFNWEISLNPALYPALDTFTPSFVSSQWQVDTGIVATTDSFSYVLSATGSNIFTYTATNEYGCSFDTTITIVIDEPPLQPTMTCSSSNSSSITISRSTVTGSNTYEINVDNGGWQTFTGTDFTVSNLQPLQSVFFQLRAVKQGGCSIPSSIDSLTCITTDCQLVSSFDSLTQVTCNGANDGIAYFSATTNLAPILFSLDNGATQADSTFTNISPGNHFVIVQDANACRDTFNFTITEPTLFTSNVTTTSVSCNGGNDGTVTLTPNGGTMPYTYNWSANANNQTTAIISNLTAGAYDYTITDANNCTIINQIIVTQPFALGISTTKKDPNCFQETTGFAVAFPTGGTGNYSYNWNTTPVQTTDTAFNLTAGTYIVIVTDANNCSINDTITLAEPNLLEITADTNRVTCFGAADGEVITTTIGGSTPYTYTWTGVNNTNSTIDTLSGGFYTVTVTDTKGCKDSITVGIYEPATPLTSTISMTAVICNNESNGTATVIPTGGAMPYSYLWDANANNQTTATASNLSIGTYNVTITDADNCTATNQITVTEPTALGLSTSLKNPNCFQENTGFGVALPSGGVAGYTYNWNSSPVQTTDTAFNLTAGTYIVIVSDANNCTISDTITLVEPNLLEITADTNRVTCFGTADGEAITTTIGGTLPYTYLWSGTNDTTAMVDTLSGGFYTVTITDALGCKDSTTVGIYEPPAIVTSFVSNQVSCFGRSDGSATVVTSGGIGTYDYQWSAIANNQTTPTASNLAGGFFRVTVTDQENCSHFDDVFVLAPPLVFVDTMISSPTLCYGSNEGMVSTSGFGGSGNLTYDWSNGGSDSALINLYAGEYIVTVSDAFGCIAIDSIDVNRPDSIEIAFTPTQLLCNGDGTGAASASIMGGTFPYIYNWSAGNSPATNISNLQSGTYQLTITDSNNCVQEDSVFVPEPVPLTATATFVAPLCFGDNNGSATIIPSGGNQGYSFSWNTLPIQTDTTAIGLSSGLYTYSVTDANNCFYQNTVTVSEPGALIVSMNSVSITCRDSANGIVTATPSGGAAPFNYNWNASTLNDSIISSLDTGTYIVTVTDNFGCVTTGNIPVTQPDYITAALSKTDLSCFESGDGSATILAGGGVGNYTYLWSINNQTSTMAVGLDSGWAAVTIRDGNNCPKQDSILITQPTEVIQTVSSTLTDCFGDNTGTATAIATGGVGFMTYLWNTSPVQQGGTASNLFTGDYIVTATDATGCIDIDTINVGQPTQLTIGLSKTDMSCFGLNNGTAKVVGTGGTVATDYSYNWSNNGITDSISGLTNITYSVSVTDDNGCVTIDSIGIIEPPILASSITPTPASCFENNDGQAIVLVTGGTPDNFGNYVYNWSTSPTQTSDTAITLMGGATYIVTVTDANNCLHTDTITIGHPDPLVLSNTTTITTCDYTNDGTATINPIGGTTPYFYNWTTNSQTTQTGISLLKGNYTTTVTDNNGCQDSIDITITGPEPILLDAISIAALCKGDANGSLLVSAMGGTPVSAGIYDFLWADNQSDSLAINLLAGFHSVTATDSLGCIGVDSFEVEEPEFDLAPNISVTDISCFDEQDGIIRINPLGGTAPYLYSTDNQTYNGVDNISGLSPNSYVFFVKDKNNCVASDTVEILEPLPFSVFLPSDTTIIYPNEVTITPILQNGLPPFTYLWTAQDSVVDCSDCIDLTTDIRGVRYLTVVDSNGCVASATVFVQVEKNIEVYVATGFSPNNDGTNDWFFVQGDDQVTKVKSLNVYDRWGELIFAAQDTDPNLPTSGWDGSFKGQQVQQGIYTWVSEIEFSDGTTEVLKGSVMLLR